MRLFPKLLSVFLAVTLAPLSFVGVRLIRETEGVLRESARTAQRETTRRAADAVGRRLERTEALLELVRRDPVLLGNDARRRDAALSDLLAADESLMEAVVHDAMGRPLGRAARDPSMPEAAPPDWNTVRPAVLERNVTRSAPKDGDLALHAALSSAPGKIRGFLTVHFDVRSLDSTLSEILPEPSSVLSLSNAAGNVLATAGANDGRESLETSSPVNGSDWTVTLRRPNRVALEAVTRARKRLVLALLVAALAAAAACLLMARRLTRPLQSLREAVRRMGDGDFRAPMPARTGDELGDLTADLRDAQLSLEKRTRDAVLGKMARMIGHDLRTPLDAVERMLAPLDAADPRRAKIARDALAAAQEFVEQMLMVGRERPPEFRDTDLNALATELLTAFPAGEGPAVESFLAEKLPLLRLDPAAARRALANVFKNAREAAASRVTVRTAAADGGASITFTDDGPGFSGEKEARLFEEFTTKADGSGLGLLVVKKVMDLHGGRVAVESVPGRGATVRLEFPHHA